MLDIEQINTTIEELEQSNTTYDTCVKLASLYIVRDNYNKRVNEAGNSVEDDVEEELDDILPQYRRYVELKRRYQMGEIGERPIEIAIKSVCKEISELIQMLYRCTDMPVERECIKEMVGNLQNL